MRARCQKSGSRGSEAGSEGGSKGPREGGRGQAERGFWPFVDLAAQTDPRQGWRGVARVERVEWVSPVARPEGEAARSGVIRMGIDENGLGPRLGPLVVTAVAARTWGKGDAIATSKPRGALAERIGDSKKLVAFGRSSLGEAWARAMARASTRGDGHVPPGRPAARGRNEGRANETEPRSPDDLIHGLSIDSREALRRPCPPRHGGQCWGTEGEAFEADDALVGTLRRDLAWLRTRGVEVLGANVSIVCTERLNESAARGISRFQADLFAMERLILHARAKYDAEVDVTCGKVGGYNVYPPAFGPLAGRLYTTVEEGRARSEYRLANLGRVAFVRDADDGHLLVAMASLIGKWVRDFLMRRVTRYHQAHDPLLPDVSGYHDPITARFVRASALARKERGIADVCFERVARSGPESGAASRESGAKDGR